MRNQAWTFLKGFLLLVALLSFAGMTACSKDEAKEQQTQTQDHEHGPDDEHDDGEHEH